MPTRMTELERHQTRGLANRRGDVDRLAWRLHGTRQRMERLRRALAARVDAHPEYQQLAKLQRVTYWAILGAFIAAYLIDVAVLSSVAEYLASSLELAPWMTSVAKYGLALAVLALEVKIASMLAVLQQRVEDRVEGRARYNVYSMVAWILALGVPAGAVGLYYAVENDLPRWSNNALMICQVLFSLTAHICLLCARRELPLALGYHHYWVRQGIDNLRAANAARSELRERQGTAAAFRDFAAAVDDYNRLNPQRPFVPAPFDLVVRAILQELFGPDVIRDVPAPPAAQPAPPQTFVPEPQAPTPAGPAPAEPVNGETEYLRDILRRRVNDADREVRP